jgi:uncharacterized protein (DUF2267 family)
VKPVVVLPGRMQPSKYPHLSDADLADVVRSRLGELIKHLDLPRLHVMCEGHVVLLHGDVDSDSHLVHILEVVAAMPEVVSVESYVHVGLIKSDVRPSQATTPSSKMFQLLHSAVRRTKIGEHAVDATIAGVLVALFDLVDAGEQRHLLSHLPNDVKALVEPALLRHQPVTVHTPPELEIAAAFQAGASLASAVTLLPAFIAILRHLVPEEDHDVQLVLNSAMRAYWQRSTE